MAEKVTVELEVKTGQTVDALNEVEKEIKDINSESVELNNTLDTLSGGAITKFKNLKSSIGGAIKGFKSLRVAIIATGIGALVIAVTSLTTAFSASEEGQNKLAKITTKIGVIFGNLTDILANVGESFWSLGEAIGNFITGDFKAAGEAFDEFKGKVNETTEAIKNFGEETRKELQIAGQIADLRAASDKQERELIVERAKANAKIIELRSKNEEKDKFTALERIGFLQEAMKLEKEIANQEIDLASKRFEAKKLENSLSKSNKEDLDEQARLEAELLNIRFASDTRNKELIAQVRATRDEIKRAREEQIGAMIELNPIGIETEITTALDDEITKRIAIRQRELDAQITQAESQRIIEETKKESFLKNADAISSALSGLTALAGQNTAAGKALGVAQATIDTFVGANKALAQGGIAGTAAAVGIIATGLANVKTILTTPIPNVVGASVGGSTPSRPNVQAPQFNLVGSGGTNQLASAIGGQTQQPVKAYVVGSEVTTQQAMDRQISSTASLGDD